MAITDLIPWRREREGPAEREEEGAIEPFRREMYRLFDDYFRGTGLRPFGEGWAAFSPRVDVSEDERQVRVSAELPGLDEGDIDVSVSRNLLTIRGEKKEEREEREGSRYYAERSYGSFQRSIPLPTEVDPDGAEAMFEKGVLTVTLPKTEEARAQKRINVKTQ
jgi:HSP20 family protein